MDAYAYWMQRINTQVAAALASAPPTLVPSPDQKDREIAYLKSLLPKADEVIKDLREKLASAEATITTQTAFHLEMVKDAGATATATKAAAASMLAQAERTFQAAAIRLNDVLIVEERIRQLPPQ